MRLVVLSVAACLALAGCSEPPPAAAPTAVPQGAQGSGGACAERARSLGFIVTGTDASYRDAYGNTIVPLLVVWGNGALHVDCRVDPQGGITVD